MHPDIPACASYSYRRCLSWLGLTLGLAALAFAARPAAAEQFIPGPAPTVAPVPSPTPDLGPIDLSAGRIVYYSDRDMVTGENGVTVHLQNGVTITGTLFAMDLKLNRYIVAGNVHLTYPGGTQDGAAFSSFLDFDRTYFVPIISEPDRWTFMGHDFSRPYKGRQMPGDTFFLPDNNHQHVFLTAKHALIRPHHSVYFKSVNLNALGIYTPVPTYFLTFSSNPNFSQNSLAGAYVDAPLPFTGSSNALSTLHGRYNSPNKFYLSFEQHLVSDNAWVVASINPMTQPQKQYNISASARLSPGLQVSTFLQESAFQQGFGFRLSASGFANFNVVGSLGNSFLVASANLYWTSLLPQPPRGIGGAYYYGDPTHPWEPDHPSNGQLSWVGFDHQINKLPLIFKLRSGVGFAHDPYVAEAYLGGVFYPTIWYNFLGGTLYTPALKLGKSQIFFNGLLDKQHGGFSLPHHIDSTFTSFSLSRAFGTKVATYAGYQVLNTGDFWGPLQTTEYPPLAPEVVLPYTNGPISAFAPDYTSFRGFATYRTLIQSITYTPNRNFQASFAMGENFDYPQPIAPVPPNEFIYGRPPLAANFDVRIKILRTLAVDVSRTYFFNFGSLRWSPQFSFRTYQPNP